MDGVLQERVATQTRWGIVTCFLLFSSSAIHLLQYILFLHPLLKSFGLFQTEELEAVDTRLLHWDLVWGMQTAPEEMGESQQWYGGDKGAGGQSTVVLVQPSSCQLC